MNFLLGAPKAGTTWLAEAMSQHPELCVSNPKEPNIIASHKGTFERDESDPNFSEYNKFFKGDGIKVDCSPHSMFCPLTPSRVFSEFPEARFIICLREPISRVVSHWNMILDTGEDKQYGADWSDFSVAWEDERLRVCSKYGEAIQRWLSLFTRDRFIFIGSRNMRDNPVQVMREIENLFSVSGHEYDFDAVEYSNSGDGRRRINRVGIAIRKVVSRVPNFIKDPLIRWLMVNRINVYQFRPLSSATDSNPRKIENEMELLVKSYLAEDMAILGDLLECDIEDIGW